MTKIVDIHGIELMQKLGHFYREFVHTFESVSGIALFKWRILRFLSQNPKSSQKQLITHLGIDAATMTRQLKLLEQEGYIERAMCKDDNRVTIVQLTQQGKSLYKRYLPKRDEILGVLLSDLSADQVDIFVNTLENLQAKLDALQLKS